VSGDSQQRALPPWQTCDAKPVVLPASDLRFLIWSLPHGVSACEYRARNVQLKIAALRLSFACDLAFRAAVTPANRDGVAFATIAECNPGVWIFSEHFAHFQLTSSDLPHDG
jgi:hypothetical protein